MDKNQFILLVTFQECTELCFLNQFFNLGGNTTELEEGFVTLIQLRMQSLASYNILVSHPKSPILRNEKTKTISDVNNDTDDATTTATTTTTATKTTTAKQTTTSTAIF